MEIILFSVQSNWDSQPRRHFSMPEGFVCLFSFILSFRSSLSVDRIAIYVKKKKRSKEAATDDWSTSVRLQFDLLPSLRIFWNRIAHDAFQVDYTDRFARPLPRTRAYTHIHTYRHESLPTSCVSHGSFSFRFVFSFFFLYLDIFFISILRL